MALTESNSMEVGVEAPFFSLIDTQDNTKKNLTALKGEKGTVIMFICNHCPFVIHVNKQLVKLAKDYTSKGISFVAISSNDISTHPQDGPEFMKTHAQKNAYPFPYLYDSTQEVAKSYDATCTPDFYLFDAELKSFYHGRLDDSRPGSSDPVTGKDLRKAIDDLLSLKVASSVQIPSMGCGIKWK